MHVHSFSTKVTSAPDVIFQTVGDEAVLLNLKTSLYLGLNPVGTRMWMTLTACRPSRRRLNRSRRV